MRENYNSGKSVTITDDNRHFQAMFTITMFKGTKNCVRRRDFIILKFETVIYGTH